jgi:phage shock protein A
MSLWKRLFNIFRAKSYKAVDAMEKVDETMDLAYEDQLGQLQRVKRGIADLTTAKKRLELQVSNQQGEVTKLDGQARQALTVGREDLAREALSRKAVAQHSLDDLQTQVETLNGQQEKLISGQKNLELKVQQFRTTKEVVKAQYSAAEAQVRIGEAATGIGDQMYDTGLAIGRVKDKVEQMQARANAIDELTAAGALEDFTGTSDDHITRELALVSQSSQVEDELAKLKAELPAGETTPELPAGETAETAKA